MEKKLKKKGKKTAKKTGGSMELKLFGPGMTAIHKVGLAGLYMTLKALGKERNKGKLGIGEWEIEPTRITLSWKGKPDAFFKKLFSESFKVDKNGLVFFEALGQPINNPESAVMLHEAFLNTFLTHSTSKTIKKNDEGIKTVGDGDTQVLLKYRKLKDYSHQHSKFSEMKETPLVGWYMPGAAVRHAKFSAETAVQESPERTIALRYAPVGAIYFSIETREVGIKPAYSLVVVDVRDMEKYASFRKVFLTKGVQRLCATSGYEAGLKVLVENEAREIAARLKTDCCRVISYGKVPWDKKKNYVVQVLDIRKASEIRLKEYMLCEKCFPPRVVKKKDGGNFYAYSAIPGFAARNIAAGRSWWEGFADFMASRDYEGKMMSKNILQYERGGLSKMVENKEAFGNELEKLYVEACQEAWRRKMGKIGDKSRRDGGVFGDQVDREREKFRVGLMRCKNAAALRACMIDFWSREGPIKQLQDNWQGIMRFFDEDSWKKGKDLALLALASYKSEAKNI